jgi:hypothetical protein
MSHKAKQISAVGLLLVTISEILSKMVRLEMGFNDQKLQHTLHKFIGFVTGNCGIILANNKYLPYDRTGNVTHCLYIANYILTAKCNIQYEYTRNMENANV